MATPQSTAAAKVIKALFAATIVYQTVYLYKAVQKNPSPYFEEERGQQQSTDNLSQQEHNNDNNNPTT